MLQRCHAAWRACVCVCGGGGGSRHAPADDFFSQFSNISVIIEPTKAWEVLAWRPKHSGVLSALVSVVLVSVVFTRGSYVTCTAGVLPRLEGVGRRGGALKGSRRGTAVLVIMAVIAVA